MKPILIVLGVIVIGGAIWYGVQTKPDASVPTATVSDVSATAESKMVADESINKPVVSNKQVDNANVKISFTGFGPGKKHLGSFSKIDSKITLVEDKIGGEIVVDMNSFSTDTEAVTKHLKTDAFFDVAKYPTATFKPTAFVGEDSIGGTITGVLTIKGKSKEVTFPFKNIKSNNATSIDGYSATFNINMKEFGIDQKFANEVIELTVTVPLR